MNYTLSGTLISWLLLVWEWWRSVIMVCSKVMLTTFARPFVWCGVITLGLIKCFSYLNNSLTASFSKISEVMQSSVISHGGGGGGVGWTNIEIFNAFLPIDSLIMWLEILGATLIAVGSFKWIKSWIPFVGK